MEGPGDANNIQVLLNYVGSLQPHLPHFNLGTVEHVFTDFRGRRAGILKALTTEVEEFCLQCDPDKDHLCLYGLPSEQWEVNLPDEDVPPELPEPAWGINFGREGMQEQDWLLSVAEHSDAWLLSVAFFFATRSGFNQADRMRLFNMISELPTVFEVVSGTAKENQEKTEGSNHSITKSASSSNEPQQEPESQGKYSRVQPGLVLHALSLEDIIKDLDGDDEDTDDDDEPVHGETLCGACGEKYASDEFWVCCDICDNWFHGKCVNITPATAEHIKLYKCPACSNKRART